MSITGEPLTSRCRQAMATLPLVSAGEGGAFCLALAGGRRAPLRLQTGDGWADLTLDAGRPERMSPWDALGLNASADGAARLILRPGDSAVTLRADVPTSEDDDPSGRLGAACADLRRLADRVQAAEDSSDSGADIAQMDEGVPDADASGVDGRAGVDLAALLTESGWPFVQRGPNRLAVDLGLPEWFQQAFITPGAGRRHRVRAKVAVLESPTAATRGAIGILLLTVSAVLRTIRGGRRDQDGETTLFFDAPIGEAPAAGDVDAALGAVAWACQMAGREARALIDERIARAYLAARGWAA